MQRARISWFAVLAACAFWAAAAVPVWAQGPGAGVGTIAGTVTDKETGKPLTPAEVLVAGTSWGAMTVEDGTFTINNLPPGTYQLDVKMMGFELESVQGVVVSAGQTARKDFELKKKVVAVLDVMQIIGKKKKIEKGRTETKHEVDAEDIAALPVDNINEVIGLQAGVIAKGGQLYFRGGRAGEVQYQVDGVPVRDPLVGGNPTLATMALTNTETILGGMQAKYGNAQSGVVIFRTKEGGEHFGGELRYITDDYGSPSNTFDNYDRVFLGVGGPTPVTDLTYYVSAEATYEDNYPKTVERRSRSKLLNFISVGDRKSNSLKLQGKLAHKPTANTKLTLEMLRQEDRYDSYFHPWSKEGYVQVFLDTTRTEEVVLRHGRWSPVPLDSSYVYYNAAEHTPNTLYQFEQYKLALMHSLSQSAQYSLKLSTQHYFRDSRVLDKKEWEYEGERYSDYWFNYTDGESYDFFVTNADYPTLSTRETYVHQVIFDLTARSGRHTIETGLSGQYNDMRLFSLTYPYLTNANGEIGSNRTRYHYYNPEGAFYIQDQWEHEGMIINAGVRYDVFSVGEQVPLSEVQERVKQQLSPRIGIAYPISDRDVFSFNYGRLYQIPDRQYLFDDLDTYEGTRGNPNLTNETTIAYQAAIQHLFSNLVAGQFSVYYKDIFGLIAAQETADWSTTGNVNQYVNKDYASSKGFEVSLSRGFANNMRWDLNYAYGNAYGVGSDPDATTSRNFVYLPNAEVPLDWDARHSVGASLYMGDRINWGISLLWDYTTGYPYTPEQRDTRETSPEMVNSRRLPSTTTVDIRLDKYYQLWGKQLSLFVHARNVLDAKNITTLSPGVFPSPPVGSAYVVYYTETGRAGGAYLSDVDDDGIEDFVPLHDPRVFGDPRTIRVGVGYQF